MTENLLHIASQFDIPAKIVDVRPIGAGLINDTYIIETAAGAPDYILQRKNKNIFRFIPQMMDNICKVTNHIKHKIIASGGDPLRESMTLISTKDAKLYYLDADDEYWATCLYIPDTITHQMADTIELARRGGEGIGRFQAMLADMNEPLADILPGFHNMRFRLEQWDKAIAKDTEGRKEFVKQEIEWIESRRNEMLDFWKKVETGELPMRVTHNDTKISNILFDKQNNVLCVIDLDTVLNSTCLNDYGDAIRSYCNPALEDEEDLNKVTFDITVFDAYTQGYLSQARQFLTSTEIENIAFSAKYLTYEQALRFLMDYIDGDIYYRVTKDKHNLIRAKGQFKLLCEMEDKYELMCEIVNACVHK